MDGDDYKQLVDAVAENTGDAVPEFALQPNPDGHGAVVIVRDGYSVVHLAGREKGKRQHIFHDLRSLAEWLNRHVPEDERDGVEILVDTTHVTAGLFPPNQYDDVVTCLLTTHPTAAEWLTIFGHEVDQKALHTFIRGHLDDFGSADAGMVLSSQIGTLKLITSGAIETSIDERGYVKFAGNTGRRDVEGSIPGSFEIKIPIILGVTDGPDPKAKEVMYEIDVLLSMDIDTERGARFTLVPLGLAKILHQARMDAVHYLTSLLDDGFLVGLGKYQTAVVPMIEVPADDPADPSDG